jgi:alkyl sulfatase BDS1-like metallo-beta-lactamase superfamily hydrolase
MGGADEVLAKARRSFDEGDYRWVAEVVNHVVFADPTNQAARDLQADALEQLGYQAESGPWRGFYLTAAQELRFGSPSGGGSGVANSADVVEAMTVELLLDYLGVRLDGLRAAEHRLVLTLEVTDVAETWAVVVERGALHCVAGRAAHDAQATVRCTKAALSELILGASDGGLDLALASGALHVEGDDGAVRILSSLLDRFELFFPIIEP